jgi:hypothetical protein
MINSNEVYLAAINTSKASVLEMTFAELFGSKAQLVQGERRFDIRRFLNKPYLIDRRLRDRRTV